MIPTTVGIIYIYRYELKSFSVFPLRGRSNSCLVISIVRMASQLTLDDLTPKILRSSPETWWEVVIGSIQPCGTERLIYCWYCETGKIVASSSYVECANCSAVSCESCASEAFPRENNPHGLCDGCLTRVEEGSLFLQEATPELTPEQKKHLVSNIKQHTQADTLVIYCSPCQQIVSSYRYDVTTCSRCQSDACRDCSSFFSSWRNDLKKGKEPVCNTCYSSS